MENKKSFGAYICAQRKALGMTQKEFADKLFLTESAVSKWERGMSYPDITMIRDICAILGVSEHELLTASEDVEARTADQLAKRYLRMLRRLKVGQYLIYGGAALICFICNLAVGHTLDWFWVVLTSELLCASLTLLPILVERQRGLITLGAFTLCLEVLLLTCALFTGTPDWFPVAALGTLLGLSVVFLPYVLQKLPLPDFLADKKGVLYFAANTVLLLLLMLSVDCYGSDHWFWMPGLPITLYCLLLPWGCFLMIRYLPWNGWFRAACCLAWTGLLELYSNGLIDWFLVRAGYASSGYYPSYYPRILPACNFANWQDPVLFNGNVQVIIALSFGAAAIVCAAIGAYTLSHPRS